MSKESVTLAESESKWSYPMVFNNPAAIDSFAIHYSQPAKSNDIRRIALLFGLDQPGLHGNGYMIWLQPYLEADLWKAVDGVPQRSIVVSKKLINSKPVSLFDVVKKYPIPFIRHHYIPEFLNFWSPLLSRISTGANKPGLLFQMISLMFFGPILLGMPFGIYQMIKKDWIMSVLVLIPPVIVSFGYSIFFTEIRYRIPIDGLLIILAVVGWRFIFKRRARES